MCMNMSMNMSVRYSVRKRDIAMWGSMISTAPLFRSSFLSSIGVVACMQPACIVWLCINAPTCTHTHTHTQSYGGNSEPKYVGVVILV